MTSITIITIVVVALLTVMIFGLAWLGYSSCLKAYRMEINTGQHDEAIKTQYKSKKKGGLVGIICSYAALLLLASVFVSGVVYRASGENFTINNTTALVIKTGSMSDFYDDTIAAEYNNDRSLQFDVGDICIFETNFDELIEGDVYGYKYKDIIITHRLRTKGETTCEFRGDANAASDVLVYPDKIIYHYTGTKIPGIGAFVLYAQSIFGIWSICGVTGIAISSEVVYRKLDAINKERNKLL